MTALWEWPADLETPCLLVDLDRLQANINRMSSALAEKNVALRPHMKTHKCREIAEMQKSAGATGISVATINEADTFANWGFDDIFIAYPMWINASKAKRLRSIQERARLRIGIDSIASAQQIGNSLRGSSAPCEAMIEIDTGQHRSGVDPTDVVEIAHAAEDAGMKVVGTFTHPGHFYGGGPEVVAMASADERHGLELAAEQLEKAGYAHLVVSAGASATALASARPPVTESRPGTYVFNDRQHRLLGACKEEDQALLVASTVISTSVKDQFVVDAGAKSLALDRPSWISRFGEIDGYPGAALTALSEEHGIVKVVSGGRPKVGEIVGIYPNHVCPAVNLFSKITVVQKGEIVDVWSVCGRY